MGDVMKQQLTAWILIVAAAAILLASRQLGLLLLVAVISMLISYLAVRMPSPQRRKILSRK